MSATIGKCKMELAAPACERLITAGFHRPGFDRGAILSFAKTCRVEADFQTDPAALQSAIRSLLYANTGGKTRLWDSIADSAIAFWKAGRRGVPWLLVCVTDGGDCASTTFEKDPAGCGNFIRHRFMHEPFNFMTLIGVGDNKAIDRPAIANFAQHAQCNAVTLAGFALLEEMFLKIAVQATTTFAGVRYTVGNYSWDELRKIRNVTHIPIDWMLLIDRSGSMYHPVN